MASVIQAWQCIGCGKVEAPQTCVGICQDKKVLLVDAREHDSELKSAQDAADGLESLVRLIAYTTPRKGEWEQTYRAMQQRARSALRQRGNPAGDVSRSPKAQ